MANFMESADAAARRFAKENIALEEEISRLKDEVSKAAAMHTEVLRELALLKDVLDAGRKLREGSFVRDVIDGEGISSIECGVDTLVLEQFVDTINDYDAAQGKEET